MFIHGLWLLPSSWDRWANVFEEAGYTALTPGWPDDPETVEEANAHPEVFAGKSVGQVADRYVAVIRRLTKKRAASRGAALAVLAVRGRRVAGLAALRRALGPAGRPAAGLARPAVVLHGRSRGRLLARRLEATPASAESRPRLRRGSRSARSS